MSTKDRVALSVRERQELAYLQSRLEGSDPELAKLLARRWHPRSWHPRSTRTRRLVLAIGHRLVASSKHIWLGSLLVVTGLAATLAAVPWVVWLSIPGALMAACGLGLTFSALKSALDAWRARSAANAVAAGRPTPGPAGTGGDEEPGSPG